MSRAPKVIDPAVSPRHRFGHALRTLRGRRGFSLQGFARRLGKSVSYLSAVELAQARCTRAFMGECERLLGAEGQLVGLWERADRDWERLRLRVAMATAEPGMTVADVQAALRAAEAEAWDSEDGAVSGVVAGTGGNGKGNGSGQAGIGKSDGVESGLVVVSVEELAALIEQSTLRALAACLAVFGKGNGTAKPDHLALDLPPTAETSTYLDLIG